MRERVVADLSHLPLHGSGSASITWWGTLGFMLIEGTGFALTLAVYLYLYTLSPIWPFDAPAPDLGPGLLNTGILLASLIPNALVSRWAGRQDRRKVQIGMVAMTVIGIAPLIVRIFEFRALHIAWDANAYGSAVWLLLGLHTTHLLTDLGETTCLAVLMFTRHGENVRRMGDIEDSTLYWNFVVLSWLPIYGCLYWIPRL